MQALLLPSHSPQVELNGSEKHGQKSSLAVAFIGVVFYSNPRNIGQTIQTQMAFNLLEVSNADG